MGKDSLFEQRNDHEILQEVTEWRNDHEIPWEVTSCLRGDMTMKSPGE